jgi:hypothetical protein
MNSAVPWPSDRELEFALQHIEIDAPFLPRKSLKSGSSGRVANRGSRHINRTGLAIIVIWD